MIAPDSADFVVKTNRGRLTQVVDNILLNAEYWLKEAQAREANFKPKLTVAYASPRLRIWKTTLAVLIRPLRMPFSSLSSL